MRQIPDQTRAGTVDDFMFKEGVKDILQKLDYDRASRTSCRSSTTT